LYKRLVRFLYTVKKDESMWVTQSAYQFLNAISNASRAERYTRSSPGFLPAGVSVPLADCLGRLNARRHPRGPAFHPSRKRCRLSCRQRSGLFRKVVQHNGGFEDPCRQEPRDILLSSGYIGGTSLYDPFLNAIDPSFLSFWMPTSRRTRSGSGL
jgi:hypothetical protein